MRIAHFVLGDEYGGGMSTQALALITSFHAKGCDVSLICSRKFHLAQEITQKGIKIYYCDNLATKRNSFVINDLYAIINVYRLLRQINPDVLHSHCVKGGYLGSFIGMLAGIKIRIMTIHGWPFNELSNFKQIVLKMLFRLLSSLVYRMVVISEHDLNISLQNKFCPKDKISMIYNGVEISENVSSVRRGKPFRALFVGRYVPSKDPYVLISAVSLLKNEDLILQMVGDGPEKDKVLSFIAGLKVENKIELLGPKNHEDVLSLMSKANVLALTTRREGFGLVLAEAMAMKTPVIGTSVGGVPELIQDNINGFLVKPNDPKDIALKIKYLMDNSTESMKMGEAGWLIAKEKFSVKKMIDQYEALYAI